MLVGLARMPYPPNRMQSPVISALSVTDPALQQLHFFPSLVGSVGL